MTVTRKDAAATVLTALVVLVFAATREGWNVWLVGDSRRWAASAIFLLGVLTCGQGSPDRGLATKVCAMLSVLALVLAALAVATGSLTALSLLVTDIGVLWSISTVRHIVGEPRQPMTA